MFRRELKGNPIVNKRFYRPRTYFDPENDILYVGCELCYSFECRKCKSLLSCWDKTGIQKILLHWERSALWKRRASLQPTNPYFELGLLWDNIKEVMILGPGTKELPPETPFGQLVKSNAPFHWQQTPNLQEDYQQSQRSKYTTVDVITRVELANGV
jgi:hypothetical protein